MPSLFKGPPGPSSQQKALTAEETQAAKFGLSQAETTLPQATSVLQQPLQFFQALLSGDRNKILQTIQPAVETLTSQYETGRRTNQEFAPRGGGAAAAEQQAPFQEAGQISSLVSQAQGEGATGVADIGSLLANLGTSELGLGSQTALGASSQLFQQQQLATETQQQQQQAAGGAIGSLLALLMAG